MRTRRDFNFGLVSLAFGGLALANCSALKKIPDAFARAPDFRRAPNRRSAGFGEIIQNTARNA
ncbi:MAG TPA: hypothetical protein VLK25_13515, partial [Allosphingosinicella sp.]|nr:hypothetical protein [Allosphingosinicella sp.]